MFRFFPTPAIEIGKVCLVYFLCADARPTSRTSDHEKAESLAIDKLAELARSPEVERLFGLFMDGWSKTVFGEGGNQPDQAEV
ncbi:MAG: hypothetical protein AAGE59_37155 [Cyanobacteria bacterium P01_F01_bin.86]